MDQPTTPQKRRGRAPKAAAKDFVFERPENREPPTKFIVIAVIGAHPINCYPLRKVLYPNSEIELEDHPWVRKQIKLGTLRLVG